MKYRAFLRRLYRNRMGYSPARKRVDKCSVCNCWDDHLKPEIGRYYNQCFECDGLCPLFTGAVHLKKEYEYYYESPAFCEKDD